MNLQKVLLSFNKVNQLDINSEFFKDFSETWHRGVMVSTTSQHQLTRTELGFSAGSNNAYVISGFAIVSF